MNRALAILGFLAAAAYWPGMIDATLVPRWAALAVMIPVCLLLLREPKETPWYVPACLAVAALSLNWAPSFADGLDEFMHLLTLAGAVWLGASIVDASPLWKGVILGTLVSVGIAVAQVLGLEIVPQVAIPAGLFGNKNFLAEASLVAGITAVAMQWWPAAILCVIGLIITGSKAAIAGAAVAMAAFLMPRRPRESWAILAVLIVTSVALFATGHHSVMSRIPIWVDSLSEVNLIGHGIGSFAANFPMYEYAHSEPLQMMYEFGLLSTPFLAVFVLAVRGWSVETEMEYVILMAVAAVAFFSFPLHLPLTAFAAAVATGRIIGHRHRMVERHAFGRMALGVGA